VQRRFIPALELFSIFGPGEFVFPDSDSENLQARIDGFVQRLAHDPCQVLQARIETSELGQGIERLAPVAVDLFFQGGRNNIDVDQVAVPIQLTAFETDFDSVVVFVEFIFRTPVAADQVVPGDKFTSNGDRIAFFFAHIASL